MNNQKSTPTPNSTSTPIEKEVKRILKQQTALLNSLLTNRLDPLYVGLVLKTINKTTLAYIAAYTATPKKDFMATLLNEEKKQHKTLMEELQTDTTFIFPAREFKRNNPDLAKKEA